MIGAHGDIDADIHFYPLRQRLAQSIRTIQLHWRQFQRAPSYSRGQPSIDAPNLTSTSSPCVAICASLRPRPASDHIASNAPDRRFAWAAGVDDLHRDIETRLAPKTLGYGAQVRPHPARSNCRLSRRGAWRRDVAAPQPLPSFRFRTLAAAGQALACLPVIMSSIAATCAAASAGVGGRSAIKAA